MQRIYRVISISLLTLMILWLVDVFIITANDTEAEVVTKARLPEELTEAMDLPDQQIQLQHIELPLPPRANVQTLDNISVDTTQTHHNAAQKTQADNNIKNGDEQIYSESKRAGIDHTIDKPTSAPLQQVRANYHALSELEPSQLRFLLPANEHARAAFLHYMYVCQNMQFGAVVTSGNQTNLMLLKDRQGIQTSDLLRVAQGQLSEQESRLLNAYAPNGVPVRIFPKVIDMQLSRYISKAIGEQVLKQFSAVYELRGNNLYLRDVVINDRQQGGSWKLSDSHCVK